MPTCTLVYGLPYIVGTDRPCDQSDTWCEFTSIVDDNLTRFDGIVDRTTDTIPMARVRMTVARTQATNPGGGTEQLIPFDTVDVDTNNMVNLTNDPFTITLPMFGVYFVYFTVEGTSAGAGNIWRINAKSVNGSSAPAQAVQQYLDDGSTPVVISSAGEFRYQSPAPAGTTGYTTIDNRLVLRADASAVGLPLTIATFGVYWLRDLP